jgi:hypothetical protein
MGSWLGEGISGEIIGGVFVVLCPGIAVLVFALLSPRRKGPECPDCGETVPRFRTNQRQRWWGGWTCANCGCEVDRYGKKLDGEPLSDDEIRLIDKGKLRGKPSLYEESIDVLDLGRKTKEQMRDAGIVTVGQLCESSGDDFLSRGFDKTTLAEIWQRLSERGLRLVGDWRLERPWWVKMALWGLADRGPASIFGWLSLVFSLACVIYSWWDVRFLAGVPFVLAALWYWMAIRWVDKYGKWP